MISFNNPCKTKPYKVFKEKYESALKLKQNSIEAIHIASYSKKLNVVDSRIVNLKMINEDGFIFFTNYKSPKAHQFKEHDQIAATLFWDTINTQIRMKGKIKKTSKKFNNQYFLSRNRSKNAVAIFSNQSQKISSYDKVIKKVDFSFQEGDKYKCPNHWGGFVFCPYSFEFWEGHKYRVNKRRLFEKINNKWIISILEP